MGNVIKINVDNQELIELTKKDGTKAIILLINEGYEQIIKYRDILINKYNFEIESEYGLTDMTSVFSYKNNKYILFYNSYEDIITFETNVNNVEDLNEYRKIAAYLQSVNVKESEQTNIEK